MTTRQVTEAEDNAIAAFIETAAAQLQEYGEMDLCDPQDREEVLDLAESSAHDELAHAANSPATFGIILGETSYYPEP